MDQQHYSYYTDVIDASNSDDFPTDLAIIARVLRTDGTTNGPTNRGMDKHTLI